MKPIEVLEKAVAQTRTVVGGVSSGDYARATPCSEWDVRTLTNHLLGVLALFESLPGGNPDMSVLGADHIGDDPLAAYDRLADGLLEAWRADGVIEGTVAFPGSELPGDFAARMVASDVVIHGWDLARALGRQVSWDQELGADGLDWHREAVDRFPPEVRTQGFAPEVAVPDDSDAMTKLIAFVGRNPA